MTQSPLIYSILVVTCLVSAYGLFVNQKFIYQYMFHMGAIRQGKQYIRLLTSAFLHGGPMHLAFNMITLWSLGQYVEIWMGTGRFALLYFGSHLAAMAYVWHWKKNNLQYAALGASAAISGVVIAFAMFQPFATLGIMMIIPMPAWMVAVLYVLISRFMMERENTIIGHEAHLGGAVAGLVLTFLMFPTIWRGWL